MKLLAKYNRLNIAATILVLLVASGCYYFVLTYVLIHQLDKDLRLEEQEVKDYVQQNNHLPNPANYKDQKTVFESTNETGKRKIFSVTLYDSTEREEQPGRRLVFYINSGGAVYKATITKSRQETEDLVRLIVLLTVSIVVLLLVVLFIINRVVFRRLWQPFNNTLQQLKQYSPGGEQTIQVQPTTITEFKELNDAVTGMTNRVAKDYEALKSFTENASHEIQTPLAVIKSKLELLMQGEHYTEAQVHYIQQIEEEINRLSKLNQSLLLLTKIENQQFSVTIPININALIHQQLDKFEELLHARQIRLSANMNNDCIVAMNEVMAGVLISNLVTNAIKHNIDKGSINIVLQNNQLIISNTGAALSTNPGELFERFKKDKAHSDSLGLGLSIVKKICEQNHFNIHYTSEGNRHIVTLLFSA
ncbi:MAG: HAMP domain-containing histidine kinase [Bacteroidetes bacterium]|nr:HAMP domain-containing histidine kinase [Bacteroidota bacterium]